MPVGLLPSTLVRMEISGGKFKGRVNNRLLDMLILWIRDFCALRGCPEDI